MPIEIRQIAIQMQVGDEPRPPNPALPFHLIDMLDEPHEEEDAQAELVERCVEAVLAELARRAER